MQWSSAVCDMQHSALPALSAATVTTATQGETVKHAATMRFCRPERHRITQVLPLQRGHEWTSQHAQCTCSMTARLFDTVVVVCCRVTVCRVVQWHLDKRTPSNPTYRHTDTTTQAQRKSRAAGQQASETVRKLKQLPVAFGNKVGSQFPILVVAISSQEKFAMLRSIQGHQQAAKAIVLIMAAFGFCLYGAGHGLGLERLPT